MREESTLLKRQVTEIHADKDGIQVEAVTITYKEEYFTQKKPDVLANLLMRTQDWFYASNRSCHVSMHEVFPNRSFQSGLCIIVTNGLTSRHGCTYQSSRYGCIGKEKAGIQQKDRWPGGRPSSASVLSSYIFPLHPNIPFFLYNRASDGGSTHEKDEHI